MSQYTAEQVEVVITSLINKWRDEAPTREQQYGDYATTAEAEVMHKCADELEAALSVKPAQVADAFRRGYDQAKLEESINADLEAKSTQPAQVAETVRCKWCPVGRLGGTAEPAAQGEALDDFAMQLACEHGETDESGTGYSFSMEQFDAFTHAFVATQPASPEQPATHSEFMQLADQVSGEFDKIDKLLEQPAGLDRSRETPRRQKAVETLIELGWTYNVERGWEQPAGRQGESAEVRKGAFGIHYIACADPNKLPVGTKLYTNPAAPVGVPDGWMPAESAPDDGTPHVRGLHVFSSTDGSYLYWDAVVGRIDTEDGQFYDLGGDLTSGWAADDFTHWHPLAAAPSAPQEVDHG